MKIFMKKKMYIITIMLLFGLITGCGKNNGGVALEEIDAEDIQVEDQMDDGKDELSDYPLAEDEEGMEVEEPEIQEDASGDDTESQEDYEYYSECTVFSKSEVEEFASMIKEQIIKKDWEDLANNLAYPITINQKTYSDKEAFIAEDWNHIFSANFYNTLDEEACVDLKFDAQGIIMADGLIVFNETDDSDTSRNGEIALKVTAIHN